MKDEQVDDLLKDLDTALSIDPSASVAARVRTRIANEPVGPAFGRPWLLVVTAAALAIFLGYVVWPAQPVAPASQPKLASVPQQSQPTAAPPAPATVAAIDQPAYSEPRRIKPRKAEEKPAGPDLRVLISPRQQLAMKQLSAAVRAGRITKESLEPVPLPTEPDPLVIDVVTIEAVKIESPIGPRGGGDLFAKRSGK